VTSATSGERLSAPALSIVRVVARRWPPVVAALAAGALLGLGASLAVTPTYQSSSRVFLTFSLSGGSSPQLDPSQVVVTEAQLVTASQSLTEIASHLRTSVGNVAGHLTAAPAPTGYYFTVTGTAASQANADKLVAAAVTVYADQLASASGPGAVRQLQDQRASLEEQAPTLDPKSDAYGDLQNEIGQLTVDIQNAQVAQAIAASNVRLAETPVEDGRIAPKTFTDVLIGALAGLFLGVASIWVWYLGRPTVLDGRAAADAIGAPLLAGAPAKAAPTSDTIVSAVAAVLSPTAKVVALTPAAAGDLSEDAVAGIAAGWSNDQGLVLVLDALPGSHMRAVLERLPRPTTAALPSWAHEQTCFARSSGGRGHVLYNRVSPSRAARPGGLAPILADRARDVDLVLLLTPPLTELPMTAASALQADAVVVVTSQASRTDELAAIPRDWPALADRIVGVIHADRGGIRLSAPAGETRPEARATVAAVPGARDQAESLDVERYARPRH
jgi:capsular polysaccharide biosynthesis protein